MAHDSLGAKNQPQYATTGAPASAADMSEVANYAANIGNRRADTDAVRLGLTGSDLWNGLEFEATDTGKTWKYAGGWVLIFQLPTAWTNFTLTSGWTATGGAWATPAYRTNQLGEVEIRGQMIPRSGYSTAEVFATLPVGSRPSSQIVLPAVNNASSTPAVAEIVVTSAGAMTLSPTGVSNVNFGSSSFATN
jgi:hypothetical protein